MKIAVIQASSQKEKNVFLEHCLKESIDLQQHEVINFGIFPEENVSYSYVQTAFCVSMLLESRAVDFVVTGCSSGQGMMLACNILPGVLCGYAPTPSNAYLFGRINDGNAVSFPLGLNFGWAGELNLKNTMRALFEEPFGIGYPPQDADRKRADTRRIKELNQITKRSLMEVIVSVDRDFLNSVLRRESVCRYILECGQNRELCKFLKYGN